MFKEFFEKYPDYTIVEKPTHKLIRKYKKALPEQLIEFWKEYGFGSFMDGYLKIINPEDYADVVFDAVAPSVGIAPIAVTGLADVWISTAAESVDMARLRYGDFTLIATHGDLKFLFDDDLTDESFVRMEMKNENYYKACERLGQPAFDECFGYAPLLGMGGIEKAENIQKVKTYEHIALIANLMGQIG